MAYSPSETEVREMVEHMAGRKVNVYHGTWDYGVVEPVDEVMFTIDGVIDLNYSDVTKWAI